MRTGKSKKNKERSIVPMLAGITLSTCIAASLAFFAMNVWQLSDVPVVVPSPIPSVMHVQVSPSPIPDEGDTVIQLLPSASPLPLPEKTRKTLYIVIDDVGHNLASLERFLVFPGRLTFAVLPGLSYSTQTAHLIMQHGQGLLLHQPMDALKGDNPGPGAINAGMGGDDIRFTLVRNLSQTGNPPGLNNHMGSKGTQDPLILRPIMELLKEKGMFFFDSKTSGASMAGEIARQTGVPYVERDVFLDNEQSRIAIEKALQEGISIAERRGYAVMIGHAWSADLVQVLIDEYPHLIEQGYDFDSLVNFFLGGRGLQAANESTIMPHSDDQSGSRKE